MIDTLVNETMISDIVKPQVRMRRLRENPAIRAMVQQTHLLPQHLVAPLFVKEGHSIKSAIVSMPGHFQWSMDCLTELLDFYSELGVVSLLLFGLPATKDAQGTRSWSDDGIIQQAIRFIKKKYPHFIVIADLCFCEYTDHGHCGVLYKKPDGSIDVDNDQTLELLVKQALSLAAAGADVLAPSGMMDGMVKALRCGLDKASYQNTLIMSYAVKYASAFYGPFREAAEGAPQQGDRRSYQMDPANSSRAIREVELDIAEGADLIMVKPAHTYLDVVHTIKQQFPAMPLAAYHVSGEYAMIMAAANNGWLDSDEALWETSLAMRRAGADIIISYAVPQLITKYKTLYEI